MSEHLFQQLQNIGMNSSEIRVYLHLLERGVLSPPEISKELKILRSNLHHILQGLLIKGLVKNQLKGKRRVYFPVEPNAVLKILDRKREAVEESLVELTLLYKSTKSKPVIKFYEGSDEIKLIFEDMLLTKNKEVVGFGSTNHLAKVVSTEFMKKIGKSMYKNGIFLKDILSSSSKEVSQRSKDNIGVYYKYRFVDDKQIGDFPTIMLVWDDKTAIIALEPNIFGMIIENKPLADTYRLQFNVMWNSLPSEEKSVFDNQ